MFLEVMSISCVLFVDITGREREIRVFFFVGLKGEREQRGKKQEKRIMV
jgi:hypothetical protein